MVRSGVRPFLKLTRYQELCRHVKSSDFDKKFVGKSVAVRLSGKPVIQAYPMSQILDDARQHNAGILAKTYDISTKASDAGGALDEASPLMQASEGKSGTSSTAVDSSTEVDEGSAGRKDNGTPEDAAGYHSSKADERQQGELSHRQHAGAPRWIF